MATDLGINRAVFKALIPSWSAMGLTMNGMIIKAKQLGFGVQRQWAQIAVRSITGLIKGEYAARNVDPGGLYPQIKMVQTELSRAYKYRVHGWGTYADLETGKQSTRRISMYTDSWLGLEAWGGEFRGDATESYLEGNEVIVSTDFKVVEHNVKMSY